jgi:hypothetical protein
VALRSKVFVAGTGTVDVVAATGLKGKEAFDLLEHAAGWAVLSQEPRR